MPLSPSRTVARATVLVAALVGGLIGLSAPAQAAPTPRVAAGPQVTAAAAPTPLPVDPPTVGAEVLPTWQLNGVAWAQVIVGDTVFVTGDFDRARPAGAAPGDPSEITVGRLFAYNLKTGERMPGFNHSLNGQGRALAASPDGSRVYVGGDFTTVGIGGDLNGAGVRMRGHLAAFNTADLSLVEDWAPNANGLVRTLAVTPSTAADGGSLYFGGSFTSVNGQPRTNLAAVPATGSVSTSGAALRPWAPTATSTLAPLKPLASSVWSMVATPDATQVIVGGSFDRLNGGVALASGAVDAITGANRPWAIQAKAHSYGEAGAVTTLTTDGVDIYGGAYNFGPRSQNTLEGTFSVKPDGGTINWVNDCQGDTYSVSIMGGVAYSVGHAHDCSTVKDFPEIRVNGLSTRWNKAIATTTDARGMIAEIDQYNWDYRGIRHPKVLGWYPELAFGSFTPSRQAAWSVVSAQGYVALAGEFPRVNGRAQQGLVRFVMPTAGGSRTSAPLAPNGIPLTVTNAPGGRVRVALTALYDRDDRTLTYELWRGGSVRVDSRQVESSQWYQPAVALYDAGAAQGATVTYQVRVRDRGGNVVYSPRSTAFTVEKSPAFKSYTQAVLADRPEHAWPLGGDTQDRGGASDLTSFGATFTTSGMGQGGSLATASWSALGTGHLESHPGEVTLEAWFRTGTSFGGRIIGFGDQPAGVASRSTRNDLVLYLTPAGTMQFAQSDGRTTRAVASSSAYNDNRWHHVAATLGADGATLFVDGLPVGSDPAAPIANLFQGYWRIGEDTLTNLPSAPANGALPGQLAHVAVYRTALTGARVLAHFQAGGGRLPNVNPTAAFTATPDFTTVAVDGAGSSDSDGAIASYTWNWGDGTPEVTAPTPTATHTYATAGTRTITLTVTDDRGGTATRSQQVTVVANQPPTAVFTQSIDLLALGVDASASADPDGTIASYAWTWGDGTAPGTGPIAGHRYAAAGTYAVTLTTTDARGATATTTRSVTVIAGSNPAPTASFTANARWMDLTVDGTASTDVAPGSIAEYLWSWGDGTPAGAGPTASHRYTTPGTYQVTLTVVDNQGGRATQTRTVTVAVNPALLEDDFGRSVLGGWGQAPLGGAWSVSGTASRWAVVDGRGGFTATAPGTGGTATSGAVNRTDTELAATLTVPALPVGGSAFSSLVGRSVSASDNHRAMLAVDPAGMVTAYLVRTVGGTETLLSAATGTPTGVRLAAGESLSVRYQVSGTDPTTLRLKAWKTGTVEPAGWLLTATDTTPVLQTAGGVAISHYLAASATVPYTVLVDDVWAGPPR